MTTEHKLELARAATRALAKTVGVLRAVQAEAILPETAYSELSQAVGRITTAMGMITKHAETLASEALRL